MHPLETYLTELREIRSTGGAVPEQSYYGALERLLNEVGKKLKPRVRCVSQVADTGAGHPDFGLYTADQFQRTKDREPLAGQLPERGVIEVKPTGDDSWLTAGGKQVTKYWGLYRQVLVTNYRDFVFVGQDESGNPLKLEPFRLAGSESAFWAAAVHARKTSQEKGDRFIEYLRRVMLHPAPLTDPQLVAWFLASYAKEAKARIEEVTDLPGLAALRQGLEESLGLKFQGEDGEHFFRATLIQTLFYGIFSSWVLWAHQRGNARPARFNWHEAAWNLHVPMIASLFEQIATPNKLKPLGIDQVLDWTGMVLNRIVQKEFFRKFEEEQAVQYFYEPFLKAYDPQLRKQLGVWYTPPEIIKYQVARVDTVLREELDIQDGLADANVYVLDPCCGTGAYLVEVLRKIHETLEKRGADALTAQRLKKAALERIFGFEILPAPFVVAHLQLGLILRNLGAPLSDKKNERAGVYLTNALTGWEPPKGPKAQIPVPFPELQEERDAAEKVKRDVPILVILGNPPYNAFAGTSPEEEGGLVEAYKQGLTTPVKNGGWGIKKFNLDDLYIRFFRIAERRIVKTGKGVVTYISNHSWVGGPSFVVLRQHLLESFDKLWIENLHGNRKISEYAPDGRTSETMFAIPGFSSGIQQGVVTSLWVRSGKGKGDQAQVLYRDDINAAKAADRRRQLLDSLNATDFVGRYHVAKPGKRNRYCFRPLSSAPQYYQWPSVDVFAAASAVTGYKENRAFSLIDDDEEALAHRMQAYFDANTPWEALEAMGTGLTRDAARFNAKKARGKVTSAEGYDSRRIRRYLLRPGEAKWCYYSPERPLWNEPRPSLFRHHFEGNAFLVTRPAGVSAPEGIPFYYTNLMADFDFIRGHSYHFPIHLRITTSAQREGGGLRPAPGEATPNLSERAQNYLRGLRLPDPGKDRETAGLLWMHSLAVGYSGAYITENADGIRQDWPRIPLPDSKSALLDSAKLGKQIAALLDTENGVSGVTTGLIRPELKTMAVVSRVGGGTLNPNEADLDLTAGWGHPGKGGITMPGKGRIIERPYSDEELEAIHNGAKALDLTPQKALENLGPDTRDIYLNDVALWKNVPANVWGYYIGGYQVIKKWLSYREKKLLGRSMKMEEVEYVSEMARRLAAIVLLQPALDENYRTVKSNTYPWPSS